MPAPASMMAPPNHLFPTLPLMSPKQKGENARDEEHDDVHDAEGPTSLQHSTILVDIGAPLSAVAALLSVVTKDTKVDVDVAGREIRAAGPGDTTQLVHAGNESADKGKVDKSHKGGRAAGGGQTEKCHNRPSAGEDGDDEEDKDEVWSQLALPIVAINEPCLRRVVSEEQ
jgi:hypothetical protein